MIFINMKSLKKFMFVLVNVLAFVLLVDCEDENYFEDTVNPENLVDPHSFYYDKQNKMMIKYKMMDTSREISEESTEIQSELVLEQSNYGSQEGVFYKRLINLLLTNIHIQDRDEMSITGLLEIKVSHSQMEMLQNFNFQKTSLRQIDEILSNIIKKPQYSYVHGVTTYIFNALQGVLLMLLEKIGDYPNEAMIAVAMLLIFLTIRMLKGGQRFSFVNFIQFICILSFFMTWWQLIQEAEIKYTAAQMKYTTIPISCQPDKMNMWDKFVSLFYSDDCEQYYKTMMTNPKLKVTPALALSHFITTVILHPITHVGTVVSDFINNATVELPWTYGWIVRCVLFLCVGLVIILIPFLLSGASFNFGLGPLLRFAISYPKSNEQGNSSHSIDKREPVQIFLQVPQEINVPQITNASKTKQSKALQVIKDRGDEENSATDSNPDSNDQEYCNDFSCGDTIKNIKLLSTDDKIEKKDNKHEDVEEVKKHVGCGDG